DPLRFLPKDRIAVLGLVTSKTGALESRDAIRRRIDEASKYAPLDQLCLSPQCGFASSDEGNTLAAEEQSAKLRMIVEIADEVWAWLVLCGGGLAAVVPARRPPDLMGGSASRDP